MRIEGFPVIGLLPRAVLGSVLFVAKRTQPEGFMGMSVRSALRALVGPMLTPQSLLAIRAASSSESVRPLVNGSRKWGQVALVVVAFLSVFMVNVSGFLQTGSRGCLNDHPVLKAVSLSANQNIHVPGSWIYMSATLPGGVSFSTHRIFKNLRPATLRTARDFAPFQLGSYNPEADFADGTSHRNSVLIWTRHTSILAQPVVRSQWGVC
jgi:hypothetical protein